MTSVLVTGAGRGIGLAITRHLSERGWDVYATARSTGDLRDLANLRNVHAIALDITDRAAVARLHEQLPSQLDGVVNNAGILRDAIFHKMSVADFELVIKVHLLGSFYVSHAAARLFRDQVWLTSTLRDEMCEAHRDRRGEVAEVANR